ncbi:MAG: hypothetical protein Q9223_002527 [Gallowayella weberi]
MPGIASGLYKQVALDCIPVSNLTGNSALFRRNFVFLTTIFAGAFVFEIGFDTALTRIWDWNNQGRQWKDIRHKYVQSEEEEEE